MLSLQDIHGYGLSVERVERFLALAGKPSHLAGEPGLLIDSRLLLRQQLSVHLIAQAKSVIRRELNRGVPLFDIPFDVFDPRVRLPASRTRALLSQAVEVGVTLLLRERVREPSAAAAVELALQEVRVFALTRADGAVVQLVDVLNALEEVARDDRVVSPLVPDALVLDLSDVEPAR
ncbi:MAG: hypothetical protein WBQ14_02110 [Gaiellaceae bacterium]